MADTYHAKRDKHRLLFFTFLPIVTSLCRQRQSGAAFSRYLFSCFLEWNDGLYADHRCRTDSWRCCIRRTILPKEITPILKKFITVKNYSVD